MGLFTKSKVKPSTSAGNLPQLQASTPNGSPARTRPAESAPTLPPLPLMQDDYRPTSSPSRRPPSSGYDPRTPPRAPSSQYSRRQGNRSSNSVEVGEIFHSPSSFYARSPAASEAGHANGGGWDAFAAGGGNEEWRSVLGGAAHPPRQPEMRREQRQEQSWTEPKRREGSLPPGAGAGDHGYHPSPPLASNAMDEFVSPPPRRSSLAHKVQAAEPSTPSRSLASPMSTPGRVPPSAVSTPTPAPNSSLHSPATNSTLNGYSPLLAFYGGSPTPSRSSTFAPSSESRLSVAGRVETPTSESEDVFDPKASAVNLLATETPSEALSRLSLDESPSLARQPNSSQQRFDVDSTPPVVVQASQQLQDSIGRPAAELGRPVPESPQRQRIAYEHKPMRAYAEERNGRRSMEESGSSTESRRGPPPVVVGPSPITTDSPRAPSLAPQRPLTPPVPTLQPSLPVSPPSQSPFAIPATSQTLAGTPPISPPTVAPVISPPSTPSRRPAGKEATPRAAALAMARERSETELPGSSVPYIDDKGPMMRSSSPRPAREYPPRPKFEQALILFPSTILKRVLDHLCWGDVCTLRVTSRSLKRCIEEDARELVLQRFLGAMGYRTHVGASRQDITLTRQSTAPRSRSTSQHPDSSPPVAKPINLTLRDLDAFLVGIEISPEQYATFAVDYLADRLHPNTLRLVRASTRAWNRVVLRLRAQSLLPPSALRSLVFASLPEAEKVYRTGRAPLLKVWVPTKKGGSWMDDDEVIECEREVWRSGVWNEMRRGDVVSNMAITALGNVGKLLHDGKYLRDFSFSFDPVGHLPPWLNALTFSPGYYHNIVASSTPNPVIYLALQALAAQIRETIVLCDDKVQISSPQGNRVVKRFVYRAAAQVQVDAPLVEGGMDVAHSDWAGTIIFEADGTTEHAKLLTSRTSSVEPTPYRVLREKSRPGRLWLRPVTDAEAS